MINKAPPRHRLVRRRPTELPSGSVYIRDCPARLGGIAASSADGNIVRLSLGLFQPIAADDVAAIVADVVLAAPRSGIVEIAGPERTPFNEIVARYLKAVGDPHEVVSDPEVRYFGDRVEERSLVPLGDVRLGRIGFDEWLRRSRAGA